MSVVPEVSEFGRVFSDFNDDLKKPFEMKKGKIVISLLFYKKGS